MAEDKTKIVGQLVYLNPKSFPAKWPTSTPEEKTKHAFKILGYEDDHDSGRVFLAAPPPAGAFNEKYEEYGFWVKRTKFGANNLIPVTPTFKIGDRVKLENSALNNAAIQFPDDINPLEQVFNVIGHYSDFSDDVNVGRYVIEVPKGWGGHDAHIAKPKIGVRINELHIKLVPKESILEEINKKTMNERITKEKSMSEKNPKKVIETSDLMKEAALRTAVKRINEACIKAICSYMTSQLKKKGDYDTRKINSTIAAIKVFLETDLGNAIFTSMLGKGFEYGLQYLPGSEDDKIHMYAEKITKELMIQGTATGMNSILDGFAKTLMPEVTSIFNQLPDLSPEDKKENEPTPKKIKKPEKKDSESVEEEQVLLVEQAVRA